MVEALRSRLSGERPGTRDQRWRSEMIDQLRLVEIEVVAELGRASSSLSRLLGLQVGDVLLLCSRRLNVDDDIVAGLIRAALRDGTPLAALARTIERRSAETVTAEDRKRDVAFVLALAGPGTAPTRFR